MKTITINLDDATVVRVANCLATLLLPLLRNENAETAALAEIVELREDNRELRRRMGDRAIEHEAVPDGYVCLKEASYETRRFGDYSSEGIRLWAVRGEVDAMRSAGQWFVRLQSVLDLAKERNP